MRVEEIAYGENILCPFCHKVLLDAETEKEPIPCEHTIFIATDYGWEYLRDDYKMLEQQHEEEDGSSFDEFTDNLNIPEVIKYSQYVPAPSFFGAYFGFLP